MIFKVPQLFRQNNFRANLSATGNTTLSSYGCLSTHFFVFFSPVLFLSLLILNAYLQLWEKVASPLPTFLLCSPIFWPKLSFHQTGCFCVGIVSMRLTMSSCSNSKDKQGKKKSLRFSDQLQAFNFLGQWGGLNFLPGATVTKYYTRGSSTFCCLAVQRHEDTKVSVHMSHAFLTLSKVPSLNLPSVLGKVRMDGHSFTSLHLYFCHPMSISMSL